MRYSEVHQRSSSLGEKVRRFITILLPIAVFFFAVWLIFVRFRQSPLSEIEEFVEKKDYAAAVNWLHGFLEEESISKPKLLMYATIVQFGLREEAIDKYNLPDYLAMLRQADQTGIFLRESYLRRLKLYPAAWFLPELICDFQTDFADKSKTDKLQKRLESAINSESKWTFSTQQCSEEFLKLPLLAPYRYVTTGSELQLREKPGLDSLVITRLDKGSPVIRRLKGPAMSLGGKKNYWFYVYTLNKEQGWLFGRYLEKD